MRLLAILMVAACGGGPAPAHPTPVPADAALPVEPAPTEAECDTLLDHTIELEVAIEDAKPTPDERHKIRSGIHDEFMHGCRAMTHELYACALAAPTMPTFTACDQASRSSSTSNSNVAPGGISPPAAPRSP